MRRMRLCLLAPCLIACSSAAVTNLTDDGGVDGEASGDGSTPLGMDGGKDGPANDGALRMDALPGTGTPPFGGSSGGAGGTANVMGAAAMAGSISFHLIVPSTYVAGTPAPLLVVYSGTEGGMTMTSNLMSLGPSSGTGGFIRAVLDGVVYNGNAIAGATVTGSALDRLAWNATTPMPESKATAAMPTSTGAVRRARDRRRNVASVSTVWGDDDDGVRRASLVRLDSWRTSAPIQPARVPKRPEDRFDSCPAFVSAVEKAIGASPGERAFEHGVEHGEIGTEARERRRQVLGVPLQDDHHVGMIERRGSGEELEGRARQRVLIGSRGDRTVDVQLFGRHVERSSAGERIFSARGSRAARQPARNRRARAARSTLR